MKFLRRMTSSSRPLNQDFHSREADRPFSVESADNENCPSYEEIMGQNGSSIHEGAQDRRPSVVQEKAIQQRGSFKLGPSLGARVAEVQSQRVRELMETYIQDLITEQVSSGLLLMAYLFIPRDSKAWKPEGALNPSELDTNGAFTGPDGNISKIIYLQEKEDTTAFWSQLTVLRKLEGEVRQALGIPREGGEEFRQWKARQKAEGLDSSTSAAQRTLTGFVSTGLKPGEVAAQASMCNFQRRVSTDLGLWESHHTGPALCVEVLIIPE